MRIKHHLFICGALFLGAPAVSAQDFSKADIVFLGEIHDNPAHHLEQARLIEVLQPAAVVFEMLTSEQVAAVPDWHGVGQVELAEAFGWAESGWPDFSMYYPIFEAAGDAIVFGAAVPREAARDAMAKGVADAFGLQADLFGLTEALPPEQQAEREALQMAAHCDALPEDMLPTMVEIQRLRDATLAKVALDALRQTGGPVAVITGNGHARKDWGAPALVALADPNVSFVSIGQAETGHTPDGGFDMLLSSDPVSRPDPCDAFR